MSPLFNPTGGSSHSFFVFFFLMTLTLLKNPGQLSCRMSLNMGSSDVYSLLDGGYAFLAY